MNEITNKEKLDLLNQTLGYLLVDNRDEDLISESLSELEGDYYTFFNPSFSKELRQKGLISAKVEKEINFLFEIINSIGRKSWNVTSFQNDSRWIKAKKTANVIEDSL